ncbi:anti-sigma regulatory factor (Ser/Thr protein kinase) [Amycolatopsis sulphurea]|uniref:Anti-sigma regulatory factor (Ser/Thr protein kinase) n=1 Tax=Amycolatopsis sulphurea TaxID=76022 RepID=A0A2A9G3A7_9PSEU|nr:sensor histidine kinase [Amycolatopsis sulphurea]PFG57290.1 anti-sigma regulatory factor (Ser/Thr protein kinase) [Amycolatopsis sulphurea]
MSSIPTFLHSAFFYGDAEEFLAGTLPFVQGGVAAGDPVAVAVPPRGLALLRAELGADAARVRMVDMTEEGRNPGRIIPGVLRAFSDGYPGRHVRIVGELRWPSGSSAEYPACVQHEALLNRSFAARRATVLCPYDTESAGEAALADAARTHPWLVDRTGQWQSSAGYAPEEVLRDSNQELTAPPGSATRTIAEGELPLLRHVATEAAVRAGFAADRLADFVLVASELVSNSIEHGSGTAVVRLATEGRQLICQVHDKGRIADPLAGRRPAVPGQVRGRGLLLVNHLADLVRLHTGPAGSTVEARFDLH